LFGRFCLLMGQSYDRNSIKSSAIVNSKLTLEIVVSLHYELSESR